MNNQTNTNEMIGNNTDRLRFPLGEPLRVVYRYRDVDSDPVTLSLDISKDGVNWQNVVEKITPGSPTVEGGNEYLFEWTPPADLDPNMYTLRLHIDDGKAKSYGDQKFIGIGDITWDGGVNQLYATNCAMSGCHSATQPVRNRDFTRHSRLTGYDGNVARDLNDNCVSCHGNTNPQKGIKLNTYADAKANADAIKTVIEGNSMPVTLSNTTPPVQTFVPLRDEVKARILKWIADGALRQDILGAGDIQNIDTQLVKYWLEPKGTTNRDRRAMPPGPAPLPAEVLGKFLIWDMQGSNWNTGNRRYDGVGNERRRRN